MNAHGHHRHEAPIAAPPREPGIGPSGAAYLDVLRAGAANAVVVNHLYGLFGLPGWPGHMGGTGVVVFFLLSGFLIVQSMLKRVGASGPKTPGFLADRAARILTPYIPALVLVALIDVAVIRRSFGQPGLIEGPVAFIGNALMLQDYPIFQVLDTAGTDVWWRIRPYNTAEPFWTVAIEMWLYIGLGIAFFAIFSRERVRTSWLLLLLGLSLPVIVWNMAAGFGQSLTLIWLAGALAGATLPKLGTMLDRTTCRLLAAAMLVVGVIALAGHVAKYGFDPYELQTAFLIGLVMFSPFIFLQTVGRVSPSLALVAAGAASYSYSLYLIHNTAIAVAWTWSGGVPGFWVLAMAVLGAHVAALLLYWLFERHHRAVAGWLRPKLEALLLPMRSPAGSHPAGEAEVSSRPH